MINKWGNITPPITKRLFIQNVDSANFTSSLSQQYELFAQIQQQYQEQVDQDTQIDLNMNNSGQSGSNI